MAPYLVSASVEAGRRHFRPPIAYRNELLTVNSPPRADPWDPHSTSAHDFTGARPPADGPALDAETVIKLLLVEDNADDVELLRRHLGHTPVRFAIETAQTGGCAAAKIQTQSDPHYDGGRGYDIVLVDHCLPDFSGKQLLKWIRHAKPALPVVMLTGHGDERLAVDVMKAGAYDYLNKETLNVETLHHVLRSVLERARLQERVRKATERLEEWAIRDGLTGLYNHRHFQEVFHNEFARAVRYGQALTCIMLDLDRFKHINDTHGHPFGDEVLCRVARTLGEAARKFDIVARYGGEEFVALLPNTDVDGAVHVAQRMRERVSGLHFESAGCTVPVTISAGVATNADRLAQDERGLLEQADRALYRAKRGGRDIVCVANGHQHQAPHAPVANRARAAEPSDAGRDSRRLFVASMRRLIETLEGPTSPWPNHSRRVAQLAKGLGTTLGLDASELEALAAGGVLHDIGRLAVVSTVWHEPRSLTDDERELVRTHAAMSESILPNEPMLRPMRAIARHHHERWDGLGYPDGLAGDRIPLLARIVNISDVYEALTSPRPWRAALSVEEARKILESGAGNVHDPDLVPAFFDALRILERGHGPRRS